VWFPAQQVAQAVRQAIGGTKAEPVRAIKLATRLAKWSPDHYGALAALRADHGVIVDAGGDLWLAEGRKAEAERDLAWMLAAAVAEQERDGSLWPNANEISGIDDHQSAKLAEALTSRVAILGGSPGTGKTYATAMLIRHLLGSGIVGQQDIAIGCPTGKAAVRITEAMQAAGVPLVARTWHRCWALERRTMRAAIGDSSTARATRGRSGS
jgi:ATP-dependent exoDNAse (exonuclease V) alpha subunit